MTISVTAAGQHGPPHPRTLVKCLRSNPVPMARRTSAAPKQATMIFEVLKTRRTGERRRARACITRLTGIGSKNGVHRRQHEHGRQKEGSKHAVKRPVCTLVHGPPPADSPRR